MLKKKKVSCEPVRYAPRVYCNHCNRFAATQSDFIQILRQGRCRSCEQEYSRSAYELSIDELEVVE